MKGSTQPRDGTIAGWRILKACQPMVGSHKLIIPIAISDFIRVIYFSFYYLNLKSSL